MTPGQPLTRSGLLAPLGQGEEAMLCGGRCRAWGSPEPRLPPRLPPQRPPTARRNLDCV